MRLERGIIYDVPQKKQKEAAFPRASGTQAAFRVMTHPSLICQVPVGEIKAHQPLCLKKPMLQWGWGWGWGGWLSTYTKDDKRVKERGPCELREWGQSVLPRAGLL